MTKSIPRQHRERFFQGALKNNKLCGIVQDTNLKIWQLQKTQKEEYE
jgi:hypothetical protein